jgi:hypothetical protein
VRTSRIRSRVADPPDSSSRACTGSVWMTG